MFKQQQTQEMRGDVVHTEYNNRIFYCYHRYTVV